MSTSIPPLLMLSESAFPVLAESGCPSTCVVISYGIGRSNATRSLCFCKSVAIGHSHSGCVTIPPFLAPCRAMPCHLLLKNLQHSP